MVQVDNLFSELRKIVPDDDQHEKLLVWMEKYHIGVLEPKTFSEEFLKLYRKIKTERVRLIEMIQRDIFNMDTHQEISDYISKLKEEVQK